MNNKLSTIIALLLLVSNSLSGQEALERKFSFKEKFNSYRTFSEFDVFYSAGIGDYSLSRGGLTFSIGKQIKDEFSCSVLLGIELYPKYDKERPLMYSNMLMPIGVNLKRYFVSNPRLIPHLSLDLGYSIPTTNGGFFVIPAVGLGIGNIKFQLGYCLQQFKPRGSDTDEILSAAQIKAGFFF